MSAEKVFSADISIHAPTRGATRFYATYFLVIRDFNPRSHEGSDAEAKRATDTEVISIHAPTRGATTFRFDVYKRLRISIHAPTRGATQAIAEVLDDMGISIHAPTRGATKYPPYSDFRTVFQSTLPRGERHLRYIPVIGTRFISIHAPTRGATGFLDVPQILLDISIHAPTRGATL